MLEYENTTAGNQAFLDTANWQGVDESLKPESHNLIESGSVHSKLYVPTLNASVSAEQTARYKQQLLSFDANTFYKLRLSVTGLSTTDIDNCSFVRLNHGTTYNSGTVKQFNLSSDDKTKLKNDGYAEWLISLDDTVASLSLWFGVNYTPTSGNTVGFSQYIFTEKYIPKSVLDVSKVVTVESESFTDTQKAQARTNIGAGSAADIATNATNINELIYDISKNAPTGGVDGTDEYSFDLCQPRLISLSLWYVIPQNLRTKDGQLIKVKSYELKKYITGIIRKSLRPDTSYAYFVFWYDAPTELNVTDNSFSSKQSIFESIYKWQLSKTISNDLSSTYGIWALGNSYNRGSYRIKIKLTGMSETDWANIMQFGFYKTLSSLVQSHTVSSQMFENSEYETDVFVLDTFAYLGFFFKSGYTPSQTIGVEFSLSIPTEKYASKDNVPTGIMPTNVFGDILPPMFKDKLIAYDKDLLIVCQGDSLTGKINTADENPDAAHSCPGGQYNSWVKLCQDIVNKDKIEYNRLDSQRNSADFFTKVGTWNWTPYTTIDSGQNNRFLESSSAADTYRSADASASIAFEFDGSVYDKCNIIFSKGNDATTNAVISITEGNGKMLVSLDRETWVEANGFNHSQFTTAADNAHDYGVARFERHRRIWMKKASADVGTIHITYSGTNSNGSYMYCWGVEMYKGVAVLFDNLGRGGRTSFLLSYNISDVFDRKPDLLIYEMPFANEQLSSTDTPTNSYEHWTYPYFVSDDGDTGSGRGGTAVSYKVQSENYTTLPVLFLLPHNRADDWEGNDAIIPSTRPNMTCPMYNLYKTWWGLLYNALKSYTNVRFVNILDQVLNEARHRELNYQEALSAGELTADGIHLNQTLSNIYAKYVAGVFNI